ARNTLGIPSASRLALVADDNVLHTREYSDGLLGADVKIVLVAECRFAFADVVAHRVGDRRLEQHRPQIEAIAFDAVRIRRTGLAFVGEHDRLIRVVVHVVALVVVDVDAVVVVSVVADVVTLVDASPELEPLDSSLLSSTCAPQPASTTAIHATRFIGVDLPAVDHRTHRS
ncbi:MAG TPA: hypothetical protein VG755_28945, partial [Nannocystaceae bacterium]|nr:hypothetical protein [Nannocystaceae bacterium]